MKKQVKQDVSELIIKMQEQLISLERKIDTLIGRSSSRPSGGGQQGQIKQDRPHRERVLYKAICADCNKECEVPFRPSQDRPVYCKECFSSRKTGSVFSANRDNKPRENAPPKQHPFAKYITKKTAPKIAKSKKRKK
jgi:CxxC-x17-CxxC domain-containing protein